MKKMNITKLKESLDIVEKSSKSKSSSKGEELIQRKPIKDTPFTVITIDGKSFGTMGKYRLTESYETFSACETELKKVTWNRLIQVMMLVNETLKENTNLIKV